MNGYENQTGKGSGTNSAPSGYRPARRKQQNTGLLRRLSQLILGVGAIVLILGLLLLILPSFRVKEITVAGNVRTEGAAIIAASGLERGDELLGISKNDMMRNIWENCPYVDEISIKISPSRVKITVTEYPADQVMYSNYGGYFYSFDRSFRVLEVSEHENDFSSFLKVTLPEITGLCAGCKLTFSNPSIDRSYIGTLLDGLEQANRLERINSLDVSEKFNLSYVTDGTTQIVLGNVSDLNVKMELADRILLSKGEGGTGYAVVDVSDLKKTTYRPLASSEQLPM